MSFEFRKKMENHIKNSKLGVNGTFLLLITIFGLGTLDALFHQSYPPPGMNLHLPQATPANPAAAKILWNYASVYFGAIYEILFLAIFYRPKLRLKDFTVWLLWMGKMLLLAMFIEQIVVYTVTNILVLQGVVNPLDYHNRRYNLWTSEHVKLHFTYEQTIWFNLLSFLLFCSFIVLEPRLRKRWEL